MDTPDNRQSIYGAILAGGRSSRMGSHKSLIELAGESLLQRQLKRLRPQVAEVALNLNHPLPFDPGAVIIADHNQDFLGPLAGVLSALTWMQNKVRAQWLLTVPIDTPFAPTDLASRLLTSSNGAPIVVAASGNRPHPTCALWHRSLITPLHDYLEIRRGRRMMAFIEEQGYQTVDFPSVPVDPFFNINAPSDLAEAAAKLKRQEH